MISLQVQYDASSLPSLATASCILSPPSAIIKSCIGQCSHAAAHLFVLHHSAAYYNSLTVQSALIMSLFMGQGNFMYIVLAAWGLGCASCSVGEILNCSNDITMR